MRKQTTRRHVNPVPAWLRPKLSRSQQQDLALCHWQNLDALSKGEGDEALLWQVVGSVLTWSRVADLLAHRNSAYADHAAEMREQLDLTTRLVERYRNTGRVLFSGPDYQRAKVGAIAMDELAELVDKDTAVAAAEWSEQKVNAMAKD